jgi:hypothetical protein
VPFYQTRACPPGEIALSRSHECETITKVAAYSNREVRGLSILCPKA